MATDRTRVAANLARHTALLEKLLNPMPRVKRVLTAIVWRDNSPYSLRIDLAPGVLWARLVSDAHYNHAIETLQGDQYTTIDELAVFLGLDEIDDLIGWRQAEAVGVQEFRGTTQDVTE